VSSHRTASLADAAPGRHRRARGSCSRRTLYEIRRRALLADLRQLPRLEARTERTRKLLRLEPELASNLLGAQSTRVLVQETDDAVDHVRDVARRSAGEPAAPDAASPGRSVRAIARSAASPATSLTTSLGGDETTTVGGRRPDQVFERSASNGDEHIGRKRRGELVELLAESGHARGQSDKPQSQNGSTSF